MVVPQLMTFLLRKKMGNHVDLLFNVTVGILFWGMVEHEPIIVTFLSMSSIAGIGGDRGQ